jgi:hypothetical protein
VYYASQKAKRFFYVDSFWRRRFIPARDIDRALISLTRFLSTPLRISPSVRILHATNRPFYVALHPPQF